MAMNAIQFQSGMSLAQFLRDYGTEAKCYRALYTEVPHFAPRILVKFLGEVNEVKELR